MTPKLLSTDAVANSIVGRQRKNNQDYVGLHEPKMPAEVAGNGRLYVLADGVGGEAKGEVASETAVRTVLEGYFALNSPIEERLTHLFQKANQTINAMAQEEGNRRMATTLVAAVLQGQTLTVAHVGDSRAYLFRGGVPDQLTKDHTLMQTLIDKGALTASDTMGFNRKNVISRSIGGEAEVETDISSFEVQPGDVVLLSSDGLHQYFDNIDELAQLIDPQRSATETAQLLVNEANERGGSDNISVVVVRILAGDSRTQAAVSKPEGHPESHEESALPDSQPVVPVLVPPRPLPPPAPAPVETPPTAARPRTGFDSLNLLTLGTIGFGVLLLVLFIGTGGLGWLMNSGQPDGVAGMGDDQTATPMVAETTPDLPLCAWRMAADDTFDTVVAASLGVAANDNVALAERQAAVLALNPHGGELVDGAVVLLPWSDPAHPFDPAAPPKHGINGVQYPDCRDFLN